MAEGITGTPGGQLVWFRRDLRDYDHAALHAALATGGPVHCLFVFERGAPCENDPRHDRRIDYQLMALRELDEALRARGGALRVATGRAIDIVPDTAITLGASAVHWNRDYEPDERAREAEISQRLTLAGIAAISHKDLVIFEPAEIHNQSGEPYRVFTPYRNAWRKRLHQVGIHPWPTQGHSFAPPSDMLPWPGLQDLGLEPSNLRAIGIHPGMKGARARFQDFCQRIDRYPDARDYPALKGPSYLSMHLRFGALSIRTVVGYAWRLGWDSANIWLDELIWREFFKMLLWHDPESAQRTMRNELRAVHWVDNPVHFTAWCQGKTGYPLVDAGMRQLAATGYMHNRLRMLTASFLCKDLGIDWRQGERWFARHLNDYDQSANVGNWQWAASTGADAQPWFRIFNPVTQSRKFDPEGRFIRRYVPELAKLDAQSIHTPWEADTRLLAAADIVLGSNYPFPLVDHDRARKRSLARFRQAKDQDEGDLFELDG